jgi:hypothetical protein
MDDAKEKRVANAFSSLLAGLQGGMTGALAMLLLLGITARFQQRSFWTSENLFASAFFGGAAITDSFTLKTLSGLALWLLLYSLLGAGFALLLRNRLRPLRTQLAGMIFGLAWYYFTFHWIWKSLLPVAYVLYSEGPMKFGHLLYGECAGRYPHYYRAAATAAEPMPVPPQSSLPPDPVSQSGSSGPDPPAPAPV